jgi:hypothetical protein
VRTYSLEHGRRRASSSVSVAPEVERVVSDLEVLVLFRSLHDLIVRDGGVVGADRRHVGQERASVETSPVKGRVGAKRTETEEKSVSIRLDSCMYRARRDERTRC